MLDTERLRTNTGSKGLPEAEKVKRSGRGSANAATCARWPEGVLPLRPILFAQRGHSVCNMTTLPNHLAASCTTKLTLSCRTRILNKKELAVLDTLHCPQHGTQLSQQTATHQSHQQVQPKRVPGETSTCNPSRGAEAG